MGRSHSHTHTKPLKAPARLPLPNHRAHSHLHPKELRPTQPPREPTYVALPCPARSARGLGGHSLPVFPSFLQVLLGSLSGTTLLSLSQQSCLAGPTFLAGGHAACASCSAWWGAGGGEVLGGGQVCSACVCAMPRPHSSACTNAPEAPAGQSFLCNPGKLVVGDDPHPLGLRAAK